ncbi:MAG TPA: hypothetical protein VFK12_06860, partial [Gammaproteobacteria bacterium]|nr:hypothetical protein [Gammaproteobacteria bacterium]
AYGTDHYSRDSQEMAPVVVDFFAAHLTPLLAVQNAVSRACQPARPETGRKKIHRVRHYTQRPQKAASIKPLPG